MVAVSARQRGVTDQSRRRPNGSDLGRDTRPAGGRHRLDPAYRRGVSATRRRHVGRMGISSEPSRIDRHTPPAGPAERRLDGRIDVSRKAGTARIPAGSRLDLGGIAKSWIGARVGALVASRCDDPAVLIDAGGDLVAVTGDHLVAVEDPTDPTGGSEPIAHLPGRCRPRRRHVRLRPPSLAQRRRPARASSNRSCHGRPGPTHPCHSGERRPRGRRRAGQSAGPPSRSHHQDVRGGVGDGR